MYLRYFDDKRRWSPHGIMFHHFHNSYNRPHAQGSITADELEHIIKHVGRENILPANIWLKKAISRELKEREICLTFDDALKCQVEVAFPVLRKFEITAFWFIFSSVFFGDINRLEVYKIFYQTYFSNFGEFYQIFEENLIAFKGQKMYQKSCKIFSEDEYLSEYEFYSKEERKFRFFRDHILVRKEFECLMDRILAQHQTTPHEISGSVWMTNEDLLMLDSFDHVIGLHSFSHPTNMKQLDAETQKDEYKKNRDHILSIVNKIPEIVSHPCGSYSKGTLDILNCLGAKVGFRSNFQKLSHGFLEFPRVDHSFILTELNQN